MDETPNHPDNRGIAGRLSRTRLATRATMTLERLWPLVVPLAIVFSLFLSMSWFGLFRLMPDFVRLTIGVLFASWCGRCSVAAAFLPFARRE